MGTLLDGRYRVGPRIARGGMATVYEATDTRLDRVVAVKVLHAGYAEDESFAYRFVREARSAAKLAHPHVVGVFDQGEDDGTLFLAMEYVPGCTLRDVIREQGPLSPTRALALLEPILSALAAAHDAGIVHRDVKPENVLLTDDGRVKVADFGLARAVTTTTSTATRGMLIGTVSYVAPELVMDGAADARSDVYSAGVVLYEMLTGRKPHQGETPIQVAYKHVHEDVPPPSELVDGVPEYLDALVARATARRRDTRPADAKVLLHQLRRVRHALDHGVYDDPELTQDLSPASRHEDGPEPTVMVSTWADQNEPTATWVLQDPERMQDGAGDDTRNGKAGTYAHRRSRKRLVGWVTLAVVLVLAAVAGVGGWYFSVGRYTNTPDLTGMTVVQARQQLRSTQLTLHKGSSAYSETVPAGDIISTDPDAGDRLLREGTVTAVVSKGKERYPMPSVVGVSEDQARTALTSGHLAVGEVTDSYNAKVEKGLVVSASKEVGDSLRPDTRVDLVVSKGPRPIDVPDLVGQSSGDARGTLRDLGLTVDVSRRYDDSAPKGEVLAQNPSEGTLFRGDSVNLVVSKGAQLTTVPSVWGQDANTATATLQSAGFIVSVQHAEGYVGFDRVASQDPGANELAPVGSTVTIYLY